MTAPALDPERERLIATWRAAIRKKQDLFEATVEATREARESERAITAYDQARGPTVPTRTASGYRNQAAPDE